MRDYELVELKLGVARDEGCAAHPSTGEAATEIQFETLIPGLSAVCVPVKDTVVRLVALTDDFDLNLLGFRTGPDAAVLLIHDDDIRELTARGVRIQLDGFATKEPLPGWHFHAFPWQDQAAISDALQALLPDFAPSYSPGDR